MASRGWTPRNAQTLVVSYLCVAGLGMMRGLEEKWTTDLADQTDPHGSDPCESVQSVPSVVYSPFGRHQHRFRTLPQIFETQLHAG